MITLDHVKSCCCTPGEDAEVRQTDRLCGRGRGRAAFRQEGRVFWGGEDLA